ncbi:MAG: hypothetical protein SOT71_00230 [Romboutsia timonensis]|uniref:hypothetical protein n=1 Tax=Romboutsia timonensis TaxID=1776391 RepID=UPI002A755038|nr:hypothetical protein [Romboutsia timonensis]MDY2881065.1 hypothetical protein [Romboutsia timonensis]
MICNCCKSTNIKYLLSDTNSTYTYCINCNNNYDIAHKHMAIDAILKSLLNYLNTSNEENLKIEVKKENNLILLIINDIKVFETQFNYDFVKKDIYYLETIISELVQDYHKFDISKIDIIVYE